MNTQIKKQWRDIYPVHPCAEIFPRLSAKEFSDLRKSLRETGLRAPVTLWLDATSNTTYLLDGRHRLDALEANGVNVIGEDAKLLAHLGEVIDSISSFGPAQLVFAANINRRHLTEKERVTLARQTLEAEKKMQQPAQKKEKSSQASDKPDKLMTAEASAVIPARQFSPTKGKRGGSSPSLIGKIAKMAGVNLDTARKHLRAAAAPQPTKASKPEKSAAAKSTTKKPPAPVARIEFRRFLSFVRTRQRLGVSRADRVVLRAIHSDIAKLLKRK